MFDLGGGGVKVSVLDFQSNGESSTLSPRSKDRRIGKLDFCKFCQKEFISFHKSGKWRIFCSRSCSNASRKVASSNTHKGVKKNRTRKACGSCVNCSSPLRDLRTIRCQKCVTAQRDMLDSLMTMGDFRVRDGR